MLGALSKPSSAHKGRGGPHHQANTPYSTRFKTMDLIGSLSRAVSGLKERRRLGRKPTEKQLRNAFARLAAMVQSKWDAFLAEHGYDQDMLLGCGVPWVDVASGTRTDAFLPGGEADQLIAQGKEPTVGVGQDLGPDSRGHLGVFDLELSIRAASQLHLASVVRSPCLPAFSGRPAVVTSQLVLPSSSVLRLPHPPP